ncbi:MAG: uroporphyrinogen-III synthase [Betaproteobacteria bacterium]
MSSAAQPQTPNEPLAGIRVVITRPAKQAATFAQRLALVGGEPVICSAMVIAPPADDAPFQAAIARLADYDFALFISANAAEAVLMQNAPWPPTLTAIAVGPTTADALVSSGVTKVLVPSTRFDSESVLALPQMQEVRGKRIVVFRGESASGGTGRDLMRSTLIERGAIVDAITCYRRALPSFDLEGLIALWKQRKVDAVIVTSAEVLDNFLSMLGPVGRGFLTSTPLFVPHSRIATHARKKGLTRVVTTEATDAGVIAGLLLYFQPKTTPPTP